MGTPAGRQKSQGGGGVGGPLGSLPQAWGEDIPSAGAAGTHFYPAEALRLLILSLRKSRAKGLESRRRGLEGCCWGNLQL